VLLSRSRKCDPRVPPFKVTQGHRNRHGSIRHLWLPIDVPWQQGAHRAVSEINGDFSRKSQIFLPPCI